MQCGRCGNAHQQGAKFCSSCGMALTPEPVAVPVPAGAPHAAHDRSTVDLPTSPMAVHNVPSGGAGAPTSGARFDGAQYAAGSLSEQPAPSAQQFYRTGNTPPHPHAAVSPPYTPPAYDPHQRTAPPAPRQHAAPHLPPQTVTPQPSPTPHVIPTPASQAAPPAPPEYHPPRPPGNAAVPYVGTPAKAQRPGSRLNTVVAVMGFLCLLCVLFIGYLVFASNNKPKQTPAADAPAPVQSTSTAPSQEPAAGGLTLKGAACPGTGAGLLAAKGNAETSCPFALSVRDEYERATQGETKDVSIQAFSPVSSQRYSMQCVGSQPVTCKGGNNAVVYLYKGEATFTRP